MKTSKRRAPLVWLLGAAILFPSCAAPPGDRAVVRVGVIGGLLRSGLWPELATRFEADSGWATEMVISGNRERVAEAFRSGAADVVLMHAGQTASDLVLDGYATRTRLWARNQFVIIGPGQDPAGVRGLRDGAVALEQIARSRAPMVDYQNSGPREVTRALWQEAGLDPEGDWLLATDSASSEEVLAFALSKQAYVVLGRIPSLPAGLDILVEGDPKMERSFVVVEPNARRLAEANVKGAVALADYLLKAETQEFLELFRAKTPAGLPVFQPVRLRARASPR